MKVNEIMTPEVVAAEPETTLEAIAVLMRDQDVGSIPIVEAGELLGTITDRDIVIRCIAQGKDPSEVTVEEVMSSNLQTVEADAEVQHAAQLMSERQIRRLPVVDKIGRLAGVVSLGDIAVKEHLHAPETAGRTLQLVSRGVKQGTGNRQTKGKARAVAEKSPAPKQEISRHAAGKQERRESQVLPFREQGHTPKRKMS